MRELDVIDQIVGSPFNLRKRRPIMMEQAQKSYDALFRIKDVGEFTIEERFAIAVFVARIHQHHETIAFYDGQLQQVSPELLKTVRSLTGDAQSNGPFGKYPDGPLTSENKFGKAWKVSEEKIQELSPKLASAFNHAHLLVFHPRDCEKKHIEILVANGWSDGEIITLSQIISFLCFQIRLVTGIQLLASNRIVQPSR